MQNSSNLLTVYFKESTKSIRSHPIHVYLKPKILRIFMYNHIVLFKLFYVLAAGVIINRF